VCTAGVLDELAAYAPVRAVLGNNDAPDVAAGHRRRAAAGGADRAGDLTGP
jgi:hypothetical protein